eukprot:3151915-Prymnesium_polylepis.3
MVFACCVRRTRAGAAAHASSGSGQAGEGGDRGGNAGGRVAGLSTCGRGAGAARAVNVKCGVAC